MATCYRHPSRETGVSCSNCGRPICPDCMTTTPVGMRCPECAKQRTKVKRVRDIATRAARDLLADRDQRARVLRRAGPVLAFGTAIHGTVIEEGVLDALARCRSGTSTGA